MAKKKIKITFFGDSICVGQGVSLHSGWAVQVSKALSDKYDNISIFSAAANGRTTRQALEVMPYEVQSNSPDILLIQFGMNDCNYWKSDNGVPRVSSEAFRANLFEIINRAACAGVKRVFVNTNHPTDRNVIFPKTTITYQQSNHQYNEIIKDVCQNSIAQLIDIEESVVNHYKKTGLSAADFLLEDGLHLNLEGHEIYYKIIYSKIAEDLNNKLNKKG